MKRFQRVSAFLMALALIVSLLPAGVFSIRSSATADTPDAGEVKNYLHASYSEETISVDGTMNLTNEPAYRRTISLPEGKLSVAWDKGNLYVAAEAAITALTINGVEVALTAGAKEVKVSFADAGIIDLTKAYSFSIKIGTMETAWNAKLIFDANVYARLGTHNNTAYGATTLESNWKFELDSLRNQGTNETTSGQLKYDMYYPKVLSDKDKTPLDFAVSYDAPTVVEMDVEVKYLPNLTTAPKDYDHWTSRNAAGGLNITIRDNSTTATTGDALVTMLYRIGTDIYLMYPDNANETVHSKKIGTYSEDYATTETYHLRMEYSYRLVGEKTVADVAYFVNGAKVAEQADVYKDGSWSSDNPIIQMVAYGEESDDETKRVEAVVANLSVTHEDAEVAEYIAGAASSAPLFYAAFYGEKTEYKRWSMPLSADLNIRAEWDWNNLYLSFIDDTVVEEGEPEAQAVELPAVKVAGKTFTPGTEELVIPWTDILDGGINAALVQAAPSITLSVGDFLGFLVLDTNVVESGIGSDFYRFNANDNTVVRNEFLSKSTETFGQTDALVANAETDTVVSFELDIVSLTNGAIVTGQRHLVNGYNILIKDDLNNSNAKAFTIGFCQIGDVRTFVHSYTNAEGTATYEDVDITAFGDQLFVRVEFDYDAGEDGVLDVTDPVAAKYYINGVLVSETDNARAATGKALTSAASRVEDLAVANRGDVWLNHLSVAHKDNTIIADKLEEEYLASMGAAEVVKQQIAALPAVENLQLTDKATVEAIRAAYEALEEDQKDYVDNLAVLEAAEAEIARLYVLSRQDYLFADAAAGIDLDGQIESAYRMNIPFTPTTQMGAVWDLTNLYIAITGDDLGEMSAVSVDGKPLTATKGAGGNEYSIPIGALNLKGDTSYDLTFTLGSLTWTGTLVLSTDDYATLPLSAATGVTLDEARQNRVAGLFTTSASAAITTIQNCFKAEGISETATIFECDVKFNAIPDGGRLSGDGRAFCVNGLSIVFQDQDTNLQEGTTKFSEAFLIGLFQQDGVMKLGFWDNAVNNGEGGYVTVNAGEAVDGQYHIRAEFKYSGDVLNDDISADYFVNGTMVAGAVYSVKQSGSGKNTTNKTISIAAYKNVDAVVSNVSVSHAKGMDAVAKKLDQTAPAQTNILLQLGADKSQMNFTWFSQSEAQGIIKFAEESKLVNGQLPEDAASVEATRGDYDKKAGYVNNKATITGLKANTTYYYQLINGEDKTELKSFKTGADGDFSFAFVGDPQIGGSGDNDRLSSDLINQHLKEEAEHWGMTLGQIKDTGVDFLVSAGDQTDTHAYNFWDKTDIAGMYGIHESQFDAFANQDVLLGLPIVTVTGNHDDDTYPVYADHVNLPNMLINPATGTYYGATYTGGTNFTGADYYFVYNNVLFLVLNTNTYYYSRTNSGEHLEFIDKVLELTAGQTFDWTIAIYHESPYGSSYHRDPEREESESYIRMRTELVPKLYEAGVDMILSGHDHCYTRTYVLKPGMENGEYTDSYVIQNQNAAAQFSNADGIFHVVGGTGSSSQVNPVEFVYEEMAKTATANTRMMTKIEITSDTLTLITYNMGTQMSNNMEEIDRFVLTNNGDATVEAAIDAIGNVTLKSEQAINEARAAYDALSPQLKKRVANYQTLVAAEARLEELKKETADKEADWDYTINGDEVTITGYNGTETDLVIPATIQGLPVTTIGSDAFSGCTSLTSITIPDSVTSIGYWAFSGCTSLTGIWVAEGNAFYNSDSHGVLFNKDKTTLIQVPEGVSGTYTIPNSVTTVGGHAFYGCSSLTSITIPDSVTSIDEGAFSSCTSLTSITIPDSVTTIGASAFYGCTSLTSIIIPDSVTAIRGYAFYDCVSLTDITIPDSVTTIGVWAFWGCDSLTGIWVGANNPNYSSDNRGVLFNKDKTRLIEVPEGISGAYTIPDGVTTIGDYAFSSCASLTSIIIPDSVTTIDVCAFYSCSNLSYHVYDNAKYLGNENNPYMVLVEPTNDNIIECLIHPDTKIIANSAFESCHSLTSITIPDSVITIGGGAFWDCDSLTSITIPVSVTAVDGYAFSDCDSLTTVYYGGTEAQRDEITIASGNEDLLSATWHYLGINEADWDYTINGNEVTITGYSGNGGAVAIPSTIDGLPVTTIGVGAFYGCTSLTSITIPDSVTIIGEGAFASCSSLTSITIPDSVTSIDGYAFDNCSSLTGITIPDSVTSIGEFVFNYCTKLSYNVYDNAKYLGNENNPYLVLVDTTSDDITECLIHPDTKIIAGPAFSFCSSLNGITIPASVTSIGYGAFENCSSLTSVTIGNGVTTIGSYAFYGCSSLTSITIPDSVTTIGSWAFSNCSNLSYNVYDNAKYLGNENNPYLVLVDTTSDDITECLIHPDTKIIAGSAFSGCTSLTSITIPDSVTIIGENAFAACTSLTSITIPDSVTTIGYDAFHECRNLTSITIPVSVTSIERYAFFGCSSLTTVNYSGTEAQRNEITIESGNEDLLSATWQCKDTAAKAVDGQIAALPAVGELTLDDTTDVAAAREAYEALTEDEAQYVTKLEALEAAEAQIEKLQALADGKHLDSNGEICEGKHNAVITAPDCENGGYTTYTCPVCNDEYVTDKTPAKGHSYTTEVEGTKVPATCKTEGSVTMACSCGAEKVETLEIDPTNHVGETELRDEEPATCGKGGYTGDTWCLDCNTKIADGEATEPTGDHNYVTEVEGTKVPATCKTEGSVTMACDCGAEKVVTLEIDPTNHVGETELRDEEPATCGKPGYTGDTVCECGVTVDEGEEIEATGEHVYATEVEGTKVPATCKTEGSVTMACSCGATEVKTLAIDPENHTGNNHVEGKLDATCGKPGYTGDTICECGVTVDEGEEIEATGEHVYATEVEGTKVPATCMSEGSVTMACGCGATEVKTLAIDPENHTFGEDGYCACGDRNPNYPVINKQPAANKDYALGEKAEFTFDITGDGITYQWYFRVDSESEWLVSYDTGCTTATLSFEVQAYRVGRQYMCVIIDAYGNKIESNAVTVKLQAPSGVITKQPEDVECMVGDKVFFELEADGKNLTYQWYISLDGWKTWQAVEGANTAKWEFTAEQWAWYKCKVTDGSGSSVWSNAVKLQAKKAELAITSQPGANNSYALNEIVEFTVDAVGDGLTYQWYFRVNSNGEWLRCYDAGCQTATLSFTMQAYRDGREYMCEVKDAYGYTEESAAVTVKLQAPSAAFIDHPDSIGINRGEDTAFTVEAVGDDLVYQWYISTDGWKTWKVVSGATSESLTIENATESAWYKCRIKDGSGKIVWSDAAQLWFNAN